MTTPADILKRMTDEIFNQPDAAARNSAIRELCSPSIRFVDAEGEVEGGDAFATKITALLASGDPSFRFHSASPYRQVAELATHTWALGVSAESPVLTGTDVAIVKQGRIELLYTLLN
jgi:hypothetical protein